MVRGAQLGLCAFSRQNVLLMESRVEAVTGGWSGLRPTAGLVGVGSPLTKNPIDEPEGGKGANPVPSADERNVCWMNCFRENNGREQFRG
jgi:hypothetical protein